MILFYCSRHFTVCFCFPFVLFLPLLEILNRAAQFQLSLYKSAVSRNTWFMCLHPASLLTAAACLGCWWLSIKIWTKKNRGRFVHQHQHTGFCLCSFSTVRKKENKSEGLLGLYFRSRASFYFFLFWIFLFFHLTQVNNRSENLIRGYKAAW